MADYHDTVTVEDYWIETNILSEGIAQSFGSTVIDGFPFMVEAATIINCDWKPLTLEYSNNDQANYSTGLIVHGPAKRIAL